MRAKKQKTIDLAQELADNLFTHGKQVAAVLFDDPGSVYIEYIDKTTDHLGGRLASNLESVQGIKEVKGDG